MIENLQEDRLSQMSTRWTEVLRAHGSDNLNSSSTFRAQQEILDRYGTPILRYLLAATRDIEIAEELAQDFALRFIRGDLKNASPQRGRFRDYLKTVLRNIVNDHFRKQSKQRCNPINELCDEYPWDNLEESFNEDWRQKLLERAWKNLQELSNTKSNHYYTVLQLRASFPDHNSSALASELSMQLNQQVSSDWVRQNLKRARAKFCELLVTEVASTLPLNSTREDIESELASLRLLKYAAIEHAK